MSHERPGSGCTSPSSARWCCARTTLDAVSYTHLDVYKRQPLAGRRFWKSLVSNNWVYPYDGMGAGPLNPDLLKTSVGSLENDLYRSLAWVIRLQYGFVKDPENPTFAEFRWASFFRSRVLFDAQLTCTKDLSLIHI